LGFSTNAFKQKLLDTIDGDADLSQIVPIPEMQYLILIFLVFQEVEEEKFIYVNGSSLLDEVGLSTTTYTVVSPNTYKLVYLLNYINF
jgi:hypothetical protein